jgi:hypothetical protein
MRRNKFDNSIGLYNPGQFSNKQSDISHVLDKMIGVYSVNRTAREQTQDIKNISHQINARVVNSVNPYRAGISLSRTAA